MKNRLSLSVPAALLLLATACGPKSTAPETADGIVLDATMNTLTLLTTAGDTLTLSTLNADPARVPGVLVDDSVQVTYLAVETDGTTVLEAQELTVTAHSPYFYIQGSWGEPNPIDPTAVQGVVLNPDGTAASIGMETLRFTGWSLIAPGTLILTGESIGNGQTLPVCDTLTIVRLDADSLVLNRADGTAAWRLGRQK